MNWNEEEDRLCEQLEILRRLRDRYGNEPIEIASDARLAVHKLWMRQLAKQKSDRPCEVFEQSAFSVTSAEADLLEYEVLEDSEQRYSVVVTRCKYADFYTERGEPEIGYAMHCALDFGETEAFSPDLVLQRTKTLMQGDDCCNHCYQRTTNTKEE